MNQLFQSLRDALSASGVTYEMTAIKREFREGDIRHSQADVSKACHLLKYVPTHEIRASIEVAMPWYVRFPGKPCPLKMPIASDARFDPPHQRALHVDCLAIECLKM